MRQGCFSQGCARFPEFLQNLSERQILWSLCSVVFHALTLRLPIQTFLSVAPELPVSLRSGENCPNFSKTSTPLVDCPVTPQEGTDITDFYSLQTSVVLLVITVKHGVLIGK